MIRKVISLHIFATVIGDNSCPSKKWPVSVNVANIGNDKVIQKSKDILYR